MTDWNFIIDPEQVAAVTRGCVQCGQACDLNWRAEFGLWRDGNGRWFAVHKWCQETYFPRPAVARGNE